MWLKYEEEKKQQEIKKYVKNHNTKIMCPTEMCRLIAQNSEKEVFFVINDFSRNPVKSKII